MCVAVFLSYCSSCNVNATSCVPAPTALVAFHHAFSNILNSMQAYARLAFYGPFTEAAEDVLRPSFRALVQQTVVSSSQHRGPFHTPICTKGHTFPQS